MAKERKKIVIRKPKPGNGKNFGESGKATQFKPGQSGNPAGTLKNPFPKLIREATDNGAEIINTVLGILRNSTSDKTKMWAAEYLRDTGWHKPVIGVRNGEGDGDDPFRIVFER